MKHLHIYLFTLIMLSSVPGLLAQDNHHFYRASYFFGEPRFEKPGLTTLEGSAAAGHTDQGRNSFGQTVPLFDIYGPYNMRLLGSGVPGKSPTNPLDLALINLAQIPPNCCFGYLSFPGSFSIVEGIVNFEQNLARGFFVQLNVPIRHFKICPGNPIDLSPDSSSCCANQSTPAWQNFLTNFDAILTRYSLSRNAIHKTDVGDIGLLVGWTYNYQKTEILDYVDTTFKFGVITPSAKAKNEDLIFDIPTGYNRHAGFQIEADISLGVYDWLTAGMHAGGLFFANRCQEIRMKTDLYQSGLIKLAKGPAQVDQGAIWDFGAFVKADHIGQGLSIILGYTFANKEPDLVCPENIVIFDPTVVNSDEQLKGWQISTIHLLVEYDFTHDDMYVGPRIGLLYNAQVGGKRIFKTNMIGGYLGIDIAWTLD